jgi:hypothetical protein
VTSPRSSTPGSARAARRSRRDGALWPRRGTRPNQPQPGRKPSRCSRAQSLPALIRTGCAVGKNVAGTSRSCQRCERRRRSRSSPLPAPPPIAGQRLGPVYHRRGHVHACARPTSIARRPLRSARGPSRRQSDAQGGWRAAL